MFFIRRLKKSFFSRLRNVIPVEEGEENDDESEVASTLGDKNPPGTTGRKAKKTSGKSQNES